MRTSEELARIFQKIECFEDLEDCEENQPRKRKMPARHSDFVVHGEGMGAAVNEVNRSDQMKRAYFATIDAILQSMQTRYYQTDILVLKSMEKILLLAANKEPYPVDEFAKLVRRYASYLDPNSLTEELEELPFVVKMHNASAPKGSIVKRVTRVGTICDIFNGNEPAKRSCANVHRMIKIYLSVPLSSATAERTFSVMRRCKTWLRAQTEGNHLNNVMFATIHKDLMDGIDVKQVAKEFCQKTEQRRNYFGWDM